MSERPTANHVPTWLASFATRFPRFAERYLTLDPRSLGLGRIYIGCLLLVDLLRRVPDLAVWYSNEGLLPNHTMLWRPGARYQFSFFFSASHADEAALLFVLCGLVFFCFLIGWKTRLFHWLSVACIVSLHDRTIFLENGGDVVLNIVAVWTLFFPMGARFSVDALLASLKARRETTLDEVQDRSALRGDTRPVMSLAVAALLLQVSVIYYFNVVHKGGFTWRDGIAVHYALHQDRMVTWLGWQVRQHLTLTLTQILTYSALAIEVLGPILVLNPFRWRATRRAAVVLMPGLHIGFALLLNLGLFSFNMIAFFVMLLPDRDWDRLVAWWRRRQNRPRVVHVDAGNALCFGLARVLARLDPAANLRFVAAAPGAPFSVEDARTGKRWQDAGALPAALAAIPFAWPLALLLRLPPFSTTLGVVHRRLAARRAEAAADLGLLPPGTAGDPSDAGGALPPRRRWLRHHLLSVREVMVVLLVIALGSQVLMENRAVPSWLKPGQAGWMRLLVEYPRLFQGWSMFAPNAPMDDVNIVVDAVTADGRHVDPFNQAGSRQAPAPTDRILEFLNQDEFWCDYAQRISGQGAYHGALSEWIQNHHRRTGREQDRIVTFEVYSITDQSPPLGQTQPTNVKKTLLFAWPSR